MLKKQQLQVLKKEQEKNLIIKIKKRKPITTLKSKKNDFKRITKNDQRRV